MKPMQAAASPAISIYATTEEIEKALRKSGALHPWDYLKDRHFLNSVEPLTVQSLEDVDMVVAKLNQDFAQYQKTNSLLTGCQKVYTFQQSMAYKRTEQISELSWAMSSLARARRTCCGCHETGSFAPREIPAYLLS